MDQPDRFHLSHLLQALFIMDFSQMRFFLQGMNTYIQFKSNQKNQGIEVYTIMRIRIVPMDPYTLL